MENKTFAAIVLAILMLFGLFMASIIFLNGYFHYGCPRYRPEIK